MKQDKQTKFLDLVQRVQACRKCPRMNGSTRVLGPGCGPINATTIFVGEAPGRLGADGSHLPFHGDKSGHNFESLLEQVGISRYHTFVTNAVLCNPKAPDGNNSTPTPTEIANCSHFLKEQVELIDPKIVVTLGAVALKACSIIEGHSLTLKESIRTSNEWFGRQLVPAYHPGQRAMMHRSFANQLSDYQFIAELTRRNGGTKKVSRSKLVSGNSRSKKLSHVTRKVLEGAPQGLSYFALHKLHFLAEVSHLEASGERLTNAYVVRQKDGPYYVDLHLNKLPALIPGIMIERRADKIFVRLPLQTRLDEENISFLTAIESESIQKTVEKYGMLPDSELKRIAYLSKPMRTLLRKERSLGLNLFNSAVLPYQELGAT